VSVLTRTTLREQWQAARPDLDLSPMTIVGGLKHANAMLELLMAPLFEAAAVSVAEFDVLLHLRHADGPTIARRLAAAMGRSPAALSKALTKLEQRGLVVREASPADRRAMLVTITPAGAEVVDEIMPRRLAIEAEVLGDLPARRRAEIERAIVALSEVIENRARNDG
jgi:DNA-binding MarR family transcriptional regulator